MSLYGACSEDILVQRSLGYYSESGYVWTGKFLYLERKSCGFKNIRIRVDGASMSPEVNIFALDTQYFSCCSLHFIE